MSFLLNVFKQISTLGQFWQERINSKFFKWNLFFIILQVIFLILKFSSLPSQVPLYYSLPWGEQQLVSASSLFLLPTLSIVLLIINHLFAITFSKSIPLLSRLLMVTSFTVSLFFLVTLFRIISLIT